METVDRVHTFYAKAWVLDAQLQRPLQTEVRPQAFVKLCEKGGYFSERAEKFRLEGIISFRSAYTQVAGTQSPKPGGGWITLATSVVEGFNVLDVVTADRVVAQISTEHPLRKGHVPSVTFLGTRFENLKIAGHKIEPKLKLDICGMTDGEQLYLANEDFRKQVTEQHNTLSQVASLPESVRARYRGKLPDSAQVQEQWEAFIRGKGPRPEAAIECSLVDPSWKTTTVNSAGRLIEAPAGHVIEIPDFGRIFLAELRVDCDSFEFNMIRLDMGCVADGKGTVGYYSVNGRTVP
jgi:hypothetical protein